MGQLHGGCNLSEIKKTLTLIRMSKEETIAKVYYDFGGFGSIAKTLADARKIDPSITQKDVQKWKDQNLQRKNQCQRL